MRWGGEIDWKEQDQQRDPMMNGPDAIAKESHLCGQNREVKSDSLDI